MIGQYVKIEKRIKANTQMAHLVLPHTQADPSQSQKSRFFSTALLKTLRDENLH